jgi:outer membrane protein assembly factor BamB
MKRIWLAITMQGLLLPMAALGGDWPQYRFDAGRTGASSDRLASRLHLQWTREFPPPRPAFPHEVRLCYDRSYEPVVLGSTMFVPSMVTDSVTALDTATGAERWTFIAGGPVRFAPVAWRDKVYFVSDDGYLYCVDAATGTQRWKFRGLPDDRKDRKLLGNQRLISLWPARGGPVLSDGVVYFAAGLWPADGVFVHALDAESGSLLWSNSDSNHIPEANMDHGIAQYAGLTPQGYLAIVNGRLVVPCGAQLPAFLDLKTGKLDTYCMGWGGRVGLPKGSWFVAGTGSFLSHSGDLYDISRRNHERFRKLRGPVDFKSRLYPGGFQRVQIDRHNQRALGNFRMPVFTSETMYDNENGIVAYDLSSGKLEDRKLNEVPAHRRNDHFPDHQDMNFAVKWRLSSNCRVHIKSGARLYAGGAGFVEAIRVPEGGGSPGVVWRALLVGTPSNMLTADGKLFVITYEGRIYAFGEHAKAKPLEHRLPATAWPAADQDSDRVASILRATGAREGYAIVLGLGAGRLTEELARQSPMYVVAVDPNADRVAELRKRFHAAGLYGARASADVGHPQYHPWPPYLANLVVFGEDDVARQAVANRESLARVLRLLRPFGGNACLPASVVDDAALKQTVAQVSATEFAVVQHGDWTVITRVGAIPGSADWSHSLADAANSNASKDTYLKSPLGLLWFDGARRWHRKPGHAEVRVAGGRVLVKTEQLGAIDVYTGRVMWVADLPFSHQPGDQLVALADAIFVTGGRTCIVVEPETGRITNRFHLPADVPGAWRNLRVDGDLVVGCAGQHVVCVDRRSGELIWKYECDRSALSVAFGGGKVFCAELVNRRKGEVASEATKTRALDAATGKIVWQIVGGSSVRYSQRHDLLVTAHGIYRGSDGQLVTETTDFDQMHNNQWCDHLSMAGNRLLWGTPQSFVVYDLPSGQRVGDQLDWVRRGCTGLRASPNLVTTRVRANCAYIDISSRAITSLWNVRPGCNNNLFPANGILNIPCLTGGCECNYTPASQAYVAQAMLE